jgi:LEA14-like dessication related protein
MRKFVVTALAAAAIVGAGCASLGRRVFEEPVVTFKGVQINGLGMSGGALDVLLGVYNPNGFDMNATRLTYRLMVDSTELGTGAIDQRFTVQDNDSTTVRLPINFKYAGLGEAGRQLLGSGTVNYRVLGDVTVSTPLGNFTRPFDRTGRYTALRGSTTTSP